MVLDPSTLPDVSDLTSGELERTKRFERSLAVIMADLDLLRNINNAYGHLAGDVVLKGVADVLREEVREYDIPSRSPVRTRARRTRPRNEYVAASPPACAIPGSMDPTRS